MILGTRGPSEKNEMSLFKSALLLAIRWFGKKKQLIVDAKNELHCCPKCLIISTSARPIGQVSLGRLSGPTRKRTDILQSFEFIVVFYCSEKIYLEKLAGVFLLTLFFISPTVSPMTQKP